jgi:peptidoglycan/xylan/chitin deacetylase (PgdA/CDA1 family)
MTSFRFDRFLTLFFFYPLQNFNNMDKRFQIPILMYHSISTTKKKGVHPYYETVTTPEIFEMHMKFLHENDYHVVDLYDVPNHFKKSGDLVKKLVVITFDDGLKDFSTEAFPILQKYGCSATVFLPTGFIGKKRMTFKGQECLSWEIVRDLHKKGIQFGSHTINHLKLYGKEEDEINYELSNSKEKIDLEIGEPTVSFSYPYAFPEQDKKFINKLRKMLTTSGYTIGVSTRIGITSKNDDRLFLKRLPINNCDDLLFFNAKLAGGYNWIHRFQLAYKKLKPAFK